MKQRFVATVRSAKGTTKHYVGLPPELNDGEDDRVLLPAAEVLVVECSKADCLLIRYTRTGVFVGDTWHENLENAQGQADFEYELASPWRRVPSDVIDPVAWANETA